MNIPPALLSIEMVKSASVLQQLSAYLGTEQGKRALMGAGIGAGAGGLLGGLTGGMGGGLAGALSGAGVGGYLGHRGGMEMPSTQNPLSRAVQDDQWRGLPPQQAPAMNLRSPQQQVFAPANMA